MSVGDRTARRFASCALSGRVLLAFAVIALPCSARADAGVPMLMLIWPASWTLFVPIVAIEAWIARRIVGLTIKQSVLASAVANAVSTLIGIPLVWGGLAVAEIAFSGGGSALGINTFWRRVYAVTVQAPWLIPYDSELHWMVPTAAIVLLVPFFFASVFIERMVFGRFCRSSPDLVRRWSWAANAATYSLTLVGLIVVLILSIVRGPVPL